MIRSLFEGMILRKWERSAKEERGEFLFIVGCGRSGNTLLRRLLMESLSIYIPPETYVMGSQILRYSRLPKKWWSEKVDLVLGTLEYHAEFKTFGVDSLSPFAIDAKEWPAERRNFYSLIDGLYRYLGKESWCECKWLGDKTPLNTLNLGIIHKAFPNAKFLYLERDPVDVVFSYLESGIYSSSIEAAERWKNSVVAWENFKKIHDEDKCFDVKYEDLVRDSERIILEIASKFNIPAKAEKESRSPKGLGDVEVYRHHSNVSNPPSTKSIGKGRAKASETLLLEIRPAILKLAIKRGYTEF